MSERKKIGSIKASKQDEAWLAYLQKSKEEEPTRLEAAAKFLSGMISLSLTIFLSTDKLLITHSPEPIVAIMVSLWLISLLLGFSVLYPIDYAVHNQSAEYIQQVHQKAVKRKQILLALSAIFFLLALGLLVILYIKQLGS